MRVLIVDDSEADRAMARRAFERLAAESRQPIIIEEAAHGGQAADALLRPASQRPDVLVCDVRMPVQVGGQRVPSGPQVMQMAESAGVRVIAYTSPGLGFARPLSHRAGLVTKGLDVYRGMRAELVDALHLRPLAAAG